MSLVPSLLNAILRLDGEALVMHVGEKPYVVTAAGQVELASRPLTFEAVAGMVAQLLPAELQRALDEFGAVQYEFPRTEEFAGERFSVVAARGGDDVWVEVRRRRIPDEDRIPHDIFSLTASAGQSDPAVEGPGEGEHDLLLPDPSHLFPDRARPPHEEQALRVGDAFWQEEPAVLVSDRPEPPAAVPAPIAATPPPAAPIVTEEAPAEAPRQPPAPIRSLPQQPAVVLSLTRSPVRGDAPPPAAGASSTGLDRLLRIAAARAASTLYLASQARPSVRVDGEIQTLSGEPLLSTADVESLLIDLMPERSREAMRDGTTTEWICDVPDVGRVRCMTFRDHRGAGGIFRMMPVHAISADQLGLSREIQALAGEPEGLVLVAGPRSSGKSTLASAFVDLINRSRRDHVITIESEIRFVHEPRSSLVSQREVRGTAEEVVAVARAALREDPDVLVIEDLRNAGLVTAALEAAGSGRLVIAALTEHTATGAIDRIIDLFPAQERRHVQLSLAETLRGVVAQVLVRKPAGGRIAAREVLLNTPAVAAAIAEGKTSQLPLAIEGGRKHGMVPLNDSLAALVQSGSVDAREAYRRAADRPAFLAVLKRQNIDTTFVERLA